MIRKSNWIHRAVWCVGGTMLGTAFAGEGGYTVERSSMRPGGPPSTGGAFVLAGTIGQPNAAIQTGNAYEMSAGFRVSFAATDCNGDHRVNLHDSSAVESCMTGPVGGASSGICACLDVDGSGGVDLRDFAELQNEFDSSP